MKTVKVFLKESRLNPLETKAYNKLMDVAKNAMIHGINSPSGKVDKAIQMELPEWEDLDGDDFDLGKVEDKVFKSLKSGIKKIK